MLKTGIRHINPEQTMVTIKKQWKYMSRHNNHHNLWRYKNKLKKQYEYRNKYYYQKQIHVIRDAYTDEIIAYRESHHSKIGKGVKKVINRKVRRCNDVVSGSMYKKIGSEYWNWMMDW